MEPDLVWLCPITQERMRDPVIAADGHTYERAAIEQWLRQSATSPVSRAPMKAAALIPNIALRAIADKVLGPLPEVPKAPAPPPLQVATGNCFMRPIPPWHSDPPVPTSTLPAPPPSGLPAPPPPAHRPARPWAVAGPTAWFRELHHTECERWQVSMIYAYDVMRIDVRLRPAAYLYNKLSIVFVKVYIAFGLAADETVTRHALVAFQTALITMIHWVLDVTNSPLERGPLLRDRIRAQLEGIGESRLYNAMAARLPSVQGLVEG